MSPHPATVRNIAKSIRGWGMIRDHEKCELRFTHFLSPGIVQSGSHKKGIMRPSALESPPPIDPRDHAIESRSWDDGQVRFHLVHHDGRYYAWITRPGHHLVYPMLSAPAARSFLASEQAFWVLTVPPGECAAHVLVLDPGGSSHIRYRAAVVDGGSEGIWLATGDGTGTEESRTLAGFADLAEAVEAFADRLTDAAGRIERDGVTDYPAVIGAALRYRAALARADAARATLGGVLRGHQARLRADRAVTAVACAVGVSREFLHRVLAASEWAWPAPARLTPAAAPPVADASPPTPRRGMGGDGHVHGRHGR
jgi:hypothetical protein